LFCNFKFFDQLHLNDRGEALIYWFVTIAHEVNSFFASLRR